MLDNIFGNVFTAGTAAAMDIGTFLISIGTALVLGLITALFYTYRSTYSKGFVVTLATLPAVVAAIIMMVSGSLGASVAVAGTFSLVRFRSAPGSAKEIAAIFLAMSSGWKLMKVKTTNLGSLNRLTYDIVFRENGSEKPMIDELRTRNGNLEISVGRQSADTSAEL